MSTRALALAALLAALVGAATARADEGPPPENVVCGGKKLGDACDVDGAAGACVTDRCTRLDYSNGAPPETVSYDCLRCQPGGRSAEAPKAVKSGCRVDAEDRGAELLLAIALGLGLAQRRRRSG